MNYINRNIRYPSPEKRIGFVASICSTDERFSGVTTQQNSTVTLKTPSKHTLVGLMPILGPGRGNYKRRKKEERLYALDHSSFKDKNEYQNAMAERRDFEIAKDFRDYHKNMIQATFIDAENYGDDWAGI